MPKKTQAQLLHDCLVLNTAEQVLIVTIQKLLYAKANTSYTLFVEVSGKVWSMSKPLRHFETNLISLGFFRIHRSYMVNLQHLRRLDKVEGLAYLINEEAVAYNTDHAKKLTQLSEE